jgi:hypothetical protein
MNRILNASPDFLLRKKKSLGAELLKLIGA